MLVTVLVQQASDLPISELRHIPSGGDLSQWLLCESADVCDSQNRQLQNSEPKTSPDLSEGRRTARDSGCSSVECNVWEHRQKSFHLRSGVQSDMRHEIWSD